MNTKQIIFHKKIALFFPTNNSWIQTIKNEAPTKINHSIFWRHSTKLNNIQNHNEINRNYWCRFGHLSCICWCCFHVLGLLLWSRLSTATTRTSTLYARLRDRLRDLTWYKTYNSEKLFAFLYFEWKKKCWWKVLMARKLYVCYGIYL